MLSGAFPPPLLLLLLMVLLLDGLYDEGHDQVPDAKLIFGHSKNSRRLRSSAQGKKNLREKIIVMFSALYTPQCNAGQQQQCSIEGEGAKIGFQIIIVISIYSFCNFQFFFQCFFFSYKCIAGARSSSIDCNLLSLSIIF